jgi:hypothetical protein
VLRAFGKRYAQRLSIMDNSANYICYLCGELLTHKEVSEDHVFQKQFVKRPQPKTKGFDYAGTLLTHKECNSLFGGSVRSPEALCGKALKVIAIVHGDSAIKERFDDWILLKETDFADFTEDDFEYFRILSSKNMLLQLCKYPELVLERNPLRIPMNVALSTLAKSAAAVLVKRYPVSRNSHWRILAGTYYSKDDFDLDIFFGRTKPFEVGVKLWIVASNKSSWVAYYKHAQLLTLFGFCFSEDTTLFRLLAEHLRGTELLLYESHTLLGLAGYDWYAHRYKSRCA